MSETKDAIYDSAMIVTMPTMSLRDWFAGQMLVGMKLSGVTGREQWFAETAYAMADAMLAARSTGPEGGKP
jgi:hypothetical protein